MPSIRFPLLRLQRVRQRAAGEHHGLGTQAVSRAYRGLVDHEVGHFLYYVYGLLHHPGYQERFADNLKPELPRIPLAPQLAYRRPPSLADARGSEPIDRAGAQVSEPRASATGKKSRRTNCDVASGTCQSNGFWAFASASKQLAELHLNRRR